MKINHPAVLIKWEGLLNSGAKVVCEADDWVWYTLNNRDYMMDSWGEVMEYDGGDLWPSGSLTTK